MSHADTCKRRSAFCEKVIEGKPLIKRTRNYSEMQCTAQYDESGRDMRHSDFVRSITDSANDKKTRKVKSKDVVNC